VICNCDRGTKAKGGRKEKRGGEDRPRCVEATLKGKNGGRQACISLSDRGGKERIGKEGKKRLQPFYHPGGKQGGEKRRETAPFQRGLLLGERGNVVPRREGKESVGVAFDENSS